MANKITFEVADGQVQKGLQRLYEATGNIKPALNVVGRKILARVKLGFPSHRSPYGEQWQPLKSRKGEPLRDTGRLLASLTYSVGGSGDSQFVDVGTNVKYAPIHQYGAIIGRASKAGPSRIVIPARPYLPIKNDDVTLPEAWAADALTALYKHFQKATR